MSTKAKQTQQNQYDPQSQQFYHGLLPGLQSGLGYYMGMNPMQNPLFSAALGMGTRQAAVQGLSPISGIMQNVAGGGWGGQLQPFQMGLLQSAAQPAMMGRQGAFGNALSAATAPQMAATGMAAGFNPLQTGGTGVQSQGGLGSWLPQLAGMGLQAGMMFL